MTPPENAVEATPVPFVPVVASEERARRYRELSAILDAWAADESSDEDQKETMEVLRKALGPERIASDRAAIR